MNEQDLKVQGVDVLNSHDGPGRNLLQEKKSCPVSFEGQNYTILTSQCKGPQYPKEQCCRAFKDFACPFRDDISDMETNCASTMFSYINLYGKYPPGLFSNMCVEGKEGLDCEANATAPASSSATLLATSTYPSLFMVTPAFVVMFHQLF
ncbi:hypothetical protein ACFE04_019916 [Oxalis oulophora]